MTERVDCCHFLLTTPLSGSRPFFRTLSQVTRVNYGTIIFRSKFSALRAQLVAAITVQAVNLIWEQLGQVAWKLARDESDKTSSRVREKIWWLRLNWDYIMYRHLRAAFYIPKFWHQRHSFCRLLSLSVGTVLGKTRLKTIRSMRVNRGINGRISDTRNYVHYDVSPVTHMFLLVSGLMS